MIRRPDTTHALIETAHGLRLSPILLAAGLLQQDHLLQDLIGLHVPHADRLLPAVDIVTAHDGVFFGSRRYPEFDLGVLPCELGEEGLNECSGWPYC